MSALLVGLSFSVGDGASPTSRFCDELKRLKPDPRRPREPNYARQDAVACRPSLLLSRLCR